MKATRYTYVPRRPGKGDFAPCFYGPHLGGWIRLIVGFQPLMVISPTASWIRWCMQVYVWWFGPVLFGPNDLRLTGIYWQDCRCLCISAPVAIQSRCRWLLREDYMAMSPDQKASWMHMRKSVAAPVEMLEHILSARMASLNDIPWDQVWKTDLILWRAQTTPAVLLATT